MRMGIIAAGAALVLLSAAPAGQAVERVVLMEMFTNTS